MTTAVITRDRLAAGLDVILTWFRLKKKDESVFTASTTTIADAADVEDGYKPPILASVEDISAGLSDDFGRMQATTMTVEISDVVRDEMTGATIRGWLGTGDTLRNCFVEFKLTTDAQRRDGGITPMTIFRGKVQRLSGSVGSGRPFSIRFECIGWIGPLLDQPLVATTISDLLPTAPVDVLDLPLPVALGVLSDEPTTDDPPVPLVDTVTSARGSFATDQVIAGFGDLDGGGSPSTEPTSVTMVETGGAGSLTAGQSYIGQATAIYSDGPSNPAPFLGQDLSVTIASDGSAIDMACDAMAGATSYRFDLGQFISGLPKWSQSIVSATPSARFTIAPVDGGPTTLDLLSSGATLPPYTKQWEYACTWLMSGGETAFSSPVVFARTGAGKRPVQFAVTGPAPVGASALVIYRRDIAGPLPSEGAFTRRWEVDVSDPDNIDADSNVLFTDDQLDTGAEIGTFTGGGQGMIPGRYCGTFTLLDGSDWHGWMLAAHACKEFVSTTLDGVPIDEGDYGVTFLAPGKTGYDTFVNASHPWLEINDVRCYMTFARGPQGDAAAVGSLGGPTIEDVTASAIRFNFKGAETTGDATGALADDGFDQLELVLKNLVLPAPSDRVLGDADWNSAIPTFPDGSDMLDHESVELAQSNYDAIISSGRNRARWYAEPITVGDFIAEQLLGLRAKAGTALDGRFQVVVLNPNATPIGEVTEDRDIEQDSFSFEDSDQGYANALPYTSGQSYAADGSLTLTDSGEAEDTTSQDSDHNDERVEASSVALATTISSTQAADVMANRLLWSKDLVRSVNVSSGLHWLSIPLGSLLPATHREGLDSDGWDGHLLQVLGLRVSALSGLVSLTTFDIKHKLATTTVPDDVTVAGSDTTATLTAAVTAFAVVNQGTVTFTLTDEDGNPVGTPVTAPVSFDRAVVTVSLSTLLGDVLLLETGDELLLETGDAIVL